MTTDNFRLMAGSSLLLLNVPNKMCAGIHRAEGGASAIGYTGHYSEGLRINFHQLGFFKCTQST